jgi:hypothetical protein
MYLIGLDSIAGVLVRLIFGTNRKWFARLRFQPEAAQKAS